MRDPALPTDPIAAPKAGADIPSTEAKPIAADTKPQVRAAAGPKAAPATRGAGVVLTALAVALLAGGLAWVWGQQQQFAETTDLAALREQLRSLQSRLAQVEQRPAAAPVPAVDLRPLEARLAALEQRPAAAVAAPDAAMAERLVVLDQRMAQAERAAARTVRIALLQRARAALDAGLPVGQIPGAPPPLARFAAVAPPTEIALRQTFPAAAQQARPASQDSGAALGMADRIWHRVLNLVTVRSGDTVLLGAPAATVLGQAAERLGAGDLAGATAALDALDPAAAAAIAAWRAQAASLLDARAALAAMQAE